VLAGAQTPGEVPLPAAPKPRQAAQDPYKRLLLSPLRYPGAKRQLAPFFVDLLAAQPARLGTFVEPLAGGASVSLHLAAAGLVDRVVLGERDKLLHAFWWTAAFDTDWLVNALPDVNVTLAQWDAYRASPGSSRRDRALACLFLNRTSFSGILFERAGPIGGRAQTGVNTIGVRWTVETLQRRLRAVGKLADEGKIDAVRRGTYSATINWALQRHGTDNTLIYLDPPFYAKAQTLYRHSFDSAAHRRLARYLRQLDAHWVLSYDAHPEVVALYRDGEQRSDLPNGKASIQADLSLVDLRYNAHSARRAGQELIVTTLPCTPDGYLRGLDLRSPNRPAHADGVHGSEDRTRLGTAPPPLQL
jgi:DNA adenine methylase